MEQEAKELNKSQRFFWRGKDMLGAWQLRRVEFGHLVDEVLVFVSLYEVFGNALWHISCPRVRPCASCHYAAIGVDKHDWPLVFPPDLFGDLDLEFIELNLGLLTRVRQSVKLAPVLDERELPVDMISSEVGFVVED